MKVKNILKGIGKLVLATSLMCGIGLFLCQDVKAVDGKVDNVNASSGGITYDVIAPDTGDKAVTAIKISIDTSPETVIKEVTSVSAGTGFSVTKEDVFGKLNSGNIFSGQKNFVVKYTLEGDATPYNNTATCSATTNQIYELTFETVTDKLEIYEFEKKSGEYVKKSNKVYLYTGSIVTVKADPVSGYVIDSWAMSGAGSSTFTASSDKKVLEVTASENNTFTPTLDAKIAKITVGGNDSSEVIIAKADNSLKTLALVAKDVSNNNISGSVNYSVSPSGLTNNIKCEIESGTTDLKIIAKAGAVTDTTFTITATKGGDSYSTQITVRPATPLTSVTINGATSGSGKGYLNTPFNLVGAVDSGASVTYSWTVSGPGGSPTSGSSQTLNYTPTAIGTHTVTLTATDDLGGSSPTKTATFTLTVDTRSNKLTLDLQNPEVTVGYKNIVVAKATEGSLNGFSASDFKLTSTDTDKVSFDSTPTISADGSTLSFVIKGEKASTDAKISISGPSGVTLTTTNNTVKVYDLGTVEYNSSSRTLSVKMPDKVITGPNLKNNLKEVTGFKLKAYHGDEEIASLEKSGKNTSVTASELENIVTNNASKFTGETDSIWFKIIPYGTNTSGDKSEAKDKDDKVISKNTDGIAVYRVQVSGENIQTTTTYGLQGQQVKVTATPNPGCSFDKWSDGSTTPTKTVTVSSTTANNNLTAKGVLGERTPGANGGANSGDTSGLDRVPKTAESNAPIWLIIVLVFAAMGGGYALYLQMRPVKEDNKSNK